jgi:hypothetical protein
MNSLGRFFSDSSSLKHNIVLAPGEVEEAVSLMRMPGKIDLSGLTFHALPRDDIPNGIGHTQIDIAVFPLSPECDDGHKCDLSKLGVGKKEEFDGLAFLSLCHAGRLRIERDFYKGHHISLKVPSEGPMQTHVKFGQLAIGQGGRDYEVLIANCDENGRHVKVNGQVLFDFSHHDSDKSKSAPSEATYPMVSLSTFLFFTLCFIRVRFTTRAAYEDTRHQSIELVNTEP